MVDSFERTLIGKPEQWLIEAAAEIGLDFSVLVHEVTDHFRNHVINRHGDRKKHGSATVTTSDFDMIPVIIKKPDMVVIGAMRWGFFCNVYVKINDGITWLYFDQVLASKRNRVLRGSTFYKVTRPLTLEDILDKITHNDKTDLEGAKILTML